MIVAAALLSITQFSIHLGKRDSTAQDSIRAEQRARADSIRRVREARPPKRIPVTAELLRSAFLDPGARTLLDRAREARLRQDTTLLSYDATSYARISAGIGFKRFGRDRLLFRHENVGRVRWLKDQGAWVDVIGARSAVPIVRGASVDLNDYEGVTPIPYWPGRDVLWLGGEQVKREVDERDIIHPLATGSEAYYRYATGDSVSFQLQDGTRITLRELRVMAREPRWNEIVGSFWFDVASAQLVRAAYRMSTPMDIVEVAAAEDAEDLDGEDDDIPRWLRPMTANLEGITIEYGLHNGRWWLPRTQVAMGSAQVSIMRVPFRLEESFRYASVNGIDTLPAFPEVALDTLTDTTARRDSDVAELADATLYRRERDNGLTVITRVPNDSAALANAPELPGSLYDSGEDLFGQEDAERLMSALDFGLQAQWNPRSPQLHLPPGEGLLRYNRVEGVSAGAMLTEQLGRGYSGGLVVRLGTADFEPNAELELSRGTGRDSVGIAAYRRLTSASDWGTPFGFGASLSSVLFGRDQGLYYRAGGAELRGLRNRTGLLTWRVFVEREWRANVETQFSVPHLLNDTRFIPNIIAERADLAGASLRYNRSIGYDPRGWRWLLDARLEGAAGDFDYGRGALDLTMSHSLLPRLDGALTLSGGSSIGELPLQRGWFLGGAQTVRGHNPATMAGDAFWMARAEVGTNRIGFRPVVFYDVGWAGDRSLFSNPGKPMQGVGTGVSVMDGLLRFDVAKGLQPNDGWRAEFYLEGRF
jgi:hypothetical protein